MIFFVGIFLNLNAIANPLNPLMNGYFSKDCRSAESTVSTFRKAPITDPNFYTLISYNKKREILKAYGYVKLDSDNRTPVLVENYNFSPENGSISPGNTFWKLRLETDGFTIIQSIDDGKIEIENGVNAYSRNSEKRFKCSSDSLAVRSAITTGEENLGKNTNLLFPEPPSASARRAIENQPISYADPLRKKLNDLVLNADALSEKRSDLEKFYFTPQTCETYKQVVITFEQFAKNQKENLDESRKTFTDMRNQLCKEVENVVVKIEQSVLEQSKRQRKVSINECLDAKTLVSKLKAGGWPDDKIKRLKNANDTCVQLAAKSNKTTEQEAKDNAIGQAFVGAMLDPAECVSYKKAKLTCAPASDFPACMTRLGMGSSFTRSKCASLTSADGW